MSIEYSKFSERGTLLEAAFSPSVLESAQAGLAARGSLLAGQRPDRQQTELVLTQLGDFASERVVNFNTGLVDAPEQVYVGGVCALSTREATLVGLGQVEDDQGDVLDVKESGELATL